MKKNKFWTLKEQRIVWQGMQANEKAPAIREKLRQAGYDRTIKNIYAMRKRLRKWGKPKKTAPGRQVISSERIKRPAAATESQREEFVRYINLPNVIKKSFFPF